MAKRKPVEGKTPRAITAAIAAASVAALPDRVTPQLATLAAKPPTQGELCYGSSSTATVVLAKIEGGEARLFTRNANDWTSKMSSLAAELAKL